MFKVLIADGFPEEKLKKLEELGFQVDYQPGLKEDTLPAALTTAQVLFVRSTKVNAEAIESAAALMLIVRVGSGTNTIDVSAASKRGVYVANCPGKNAVAVAELTIGLMVGVDRQIPAATASLKAGKWEKKKFSAADGLKGKTFGVVGVGRIGSAVIERVKAFGMPILGWDKFLTDAQAKRLDIERCDTLDELCQRADVISVHLPLLDDTRGMFDARRFGLCQPGTIFLNTSRGEIHDQDALVEAVHSGQIRAGLDVFHNEPNAKTADFADPLLTHDHIVATPHIGASTNQAQRAVAQEAIRILESFTSGAGVPNCVNLKQHTPLDCKMIVRHYDKVGVLASVMDLLQADNINIEEMSNTVFQGAEAAVATMSLSHKPSDALCQKLEAMTDTIIQVTVL